MSAFLNVMVPSADPASILEHQGCLRRLARPADIIVLAYEAAVTLIVEAGPPGALKDMTRKYRSIARQLLEDDELEVDSDTRTDLVALSRLEDDAASMLLRPRLRTMFINKAEWEINTAQRLPTWRYFAEVLVCPELLELLAASVDFDRSMPPDARVREYLSIEAFTLPFARRAARSTESIVRFLLAATDPQIRADRALARKLPLLCVLKACHAVEPAHELAPPGVQRTSLASICLELALREATHEGALDGGLWRNVVSFL